MEYRLRPVDGGGALAAADHVRLLRTGRTSAARRPSGSPVHGWIRHRSWPGQALGNQASIAGVLLAPGVTTLGS
jgi:hypothetical protein